MYITICACVGKIRKKFIKKNIYFNFYIIIIEVFWKHVLMFLIHWARINFRKSNASFVRTNEQHMQIHFANISFAAAASLMFNVNVNHYEIGIQFRKNHFSF